MARSRLIKYFGKQLEFVYKNTYNSKMTTRDIHKETDIPYWLLEALIKEGIIQDTLNPEQFGILKALMFGLKSDKFLRYALGRRSKATRKKFLETAGKSRLEAWVQSRVFNIKDSGGRLSRKYIYHEALSIFPVLQRQGDFGFYSICRMISNASKQYRRQKSGHNINNTESGQKQELTDKKTV